ncbi:hypothetical protein NPIL_498141 [Nephila pilipes]|uniref:Uncharacterized protein n=1 Tax=Nephila pilipes TaxID=299642 RepID=A0A8X6JMN2_NEPPI|nr:hypothetical protein NPIL_498141 [Nephila pilipes]
MSSRKSMFPLFDYRVEISDRHYHNKFGIPLRKMGMKYVKCVVPFRRDLKPVPKEEEYESYDSKLYLYEIEGKCYNLRMVRSSNRIGKRFLVLRDERNVRAF